MAIDFPAIDPVIFSWGSLKATWYGLSYAMAFLIGSWYLGYFSRKNKLKIPNDFWDHLFIWAIIGVVVGGRLGYILFYNFSDYLQDPLRILKTWHGGMSFHGGLLGMIFAVFLYSRKRQQNFWQIIDLIAIVAPIGLFLGRLANFINGELYGRVTSLSWGVFFPGQGLARHPSQLYEAALEGVVLLLILLRVSKKHLHSEGVISGYFLLFYGLFRTIAECFREPDLHIGFVFQGLTLGQLLTMPMVLCGVFLIYSRIYGKSNNTS